jgi:predicted aconitase with swiveling domain
MWSMTLDMVCRFGHTQATMIITKLDPVVLGCVLEETPLVQVTGTDIFGQIRTGDRVTADANAGEISLDQRR